MDSIVKINSLDDEPDVTPYNFNKEEFYKSDKTSGNNFYNFEKLKKLLSKEELVDLTDNPNKILRMYSIRERILNQDKTLDIKKAFLNEFRRKDSIQTISGCIVDYDPTSFIVYNDYWNVACGNVYEAIKSPTEKEQRDFQINSLMQDKRMMETNEAIISNESDMFWLIYDRMFDGLTYNKNLNPSILKLVQNNNNSYAFDYLLTNFPKEYTDLDKDYYTNYFPYADFENQNAVVYLFRLTEHAFESKNQQYIDIVLKKLKEGKTWRYSESRFRNEIFDKYDVKF